MPGHRFTKDDKPNVPGSSPSSSGFSDLEKMIGQDLNNKFGHPGGFGGGGMGGGGNNFNNPYQNIDPRGFMGNNGGNPGNVGPGQNPGNFGPGQNPGNFGPNSQSPGNYGPTVPGGNQYVGGNMQPGNVPGGANIPSNAPPGGYSGNLGPAFFVPEDVVAKDHGPVKQSIKDIKDIDYYPEMEADPALFNKGGFQDADFDQICERLKKGL